MLYFFQPLEHLRPIRVWAREHGAALALDADTFRLRITRAGRTATFYPRFALTTASGLAYTGHFGDKGPFIGWLPYELKRWPLASDKLVFKAFCREVGLPTPAAWNDGPPLAPHFIVKGRQGSFGQGIRGPFRAERAERVELSAGEYCEQFVAGDCVKIWCWNGKPTAMERLAAPFVTGDGLRSLREIVATARGSFDTSFDIASADADLLAWQDVTADSVLPAGRRVMLDFKYTSAFDPLDVRNRDVLDKQSQALRAQLQQIGNTLGGAIAAEVRQDTVFTVDGVIDDNEQIWLLEMNCHPMVHPANYSHMLDSLFSSK